MTGFYKGSGGAIYEMDPPDPAKYPHVAEDFAAKLEKGDLVLLDPATVVKVPNHPDREDWGYRWEQIDPASVPSPAKKVGKQPVEDNFDEKE